MKIENLKELEKLIKLCKKHGIETIEADGVKFSVDLHAQLTPSAKATKPTTSVQSTTIDEDSKIELPDELTEEQLLNWSVTGEHQ